MSVDLAHPAAEKIVLVLEGTGDDKVRVNSSSLDHPLVVLPEQALEIVGIAKKVIGLLVKPRSERFGRGGLRSDDQVTHYMPVCNALQRVV
jgi:uncharacterized protein YjeT (DUF2065 family)